jgi:hypothetical protein
MTKRILIPYFSGGLRSITPLIAAAGIYLIISSAPVWGMILILVAGIVFTTRYVTEISLKTNTCRDYISMLGLSFREERKKFRKADRIVITRGHYSQRVQSYVQSRQLSWTDYTGTLLLDNDSLELLTRNDKRVLIEGLKEFADFLKVGVEDRTTNEYFWIDLTGIKTNVRD